LRASLSPQIRHFHLRLLQPVRHPHLAIHRRRRGEVLSGPLALVGAVVELAEAEVAVGLQRTHAEFLSRTEDVRVVGFRQVPL
jgi:hypothetical protein